MKAKVKQVFLCTFIFLAVLLAVSRAQMSGDEEFNDAERDETSVINPKQEQENQESEADSWWQDKADTNKDGSVDDEELSAWKELVNRCIDSNNDGQIDDKEKRLVWKCARLPITMDFERDFDDDNDGCLESGEARKLLFRIVEYVFQTNGKGAIKSEIEELYDTNDDGVIDLQELKLIREDLK